MKSTKKQKEPTQNSSIEAQVSGTVSGQVAIGNNIIQTQSIQHGSNQLSEADLKVLQNLFLELKTQINITAPIDKKETALEKTSELEEAITAQKPDITTMEYVRNWFVKNIPQLAGTVTGLVINPIVGKLVEAAGETVAHEFKRRFSTE